MTLQVRLLLSPLYSSAPLSRVEHCYSNRRRFAFVGQRGARRYRCHSGGNDREVSWCVFLCHAPCTCHGDFFKI